MEATRVDDPFFWDVETVAKNLGAPGQPWVREPAALVAAVVEEELDGKTLLTFEHLYSQMDLVQCLGIKPARHKAALGEAIWELRSSSQGYQSWMKEFLRKQSGAPPEEVATCETHISGTPADTAPKPTPPPGETASSLTNQVLGDFGDDQNEPLPSTALERAEPAPKRRRIAPVTLTERPLKVSSAFIPTEADTITLQTKPGQADRDGNLPWETASPTAYIGDGSLTSGAIQSSSEPLSSRIVEDGESFATLLPNHLPAGRRIAVYQATKRMLRRNGRRACYLAKTGYLSRSASLSEDDEVIDLFDLPDTHDEQTLREMELEQQDLERHRALEGQFLTRERIESILDEVVTSITSTWEERKLPKHMRKAYRQWHDARRLGKRTKQVLHARQQAKAYDDRIRKLRTEIVDQVWKKESEVRSQALCLEQSVQDRVYYRWFADMLEARIEPAKPQTITKTAHPTVHEARSSHDDEILTSSDEEDFIVPDEEHQSVDGDPMDVDEGFSELSHQAEFVKEEMPAYVDLTQTETPRSLKNSNKKSNFIDLTGLPSPSKLKLEFRARGAEKQTEDVPPKQEPKVSGPINAPSIESLGSWEEIGAAPPKRWAKENDRWRLIINVIWNLTHARRGALLDAILEKPLDDAWEQSVRSELSNPVEDPEQAGLLTSRLAAFDVTRAFLCFFRCKHYSQGRTVALSDRTKKNVEQARHTWFSPFCVFLNKNASLFPQDSQIHNTLAAEDFLENELLEDELLDDELLSDVEPTVDNENSQLGARKPAPKEIIQNRAAVNLRERERQRQDEQEARKEKLRAILANSDSLPQDKTRLIINESKLEDESLIYINEEIGKRIKEHQIDGVRFMWNQVVLGDSETRQGCLLAHDMGLGKTMQVITFLTALIEAARSPDPSVRAQIPKHLRESRTLVICPPGVVDNWIDELLMWVPDNLLGPLRKLSTHMLFQERISEVKDWGANGGVLVIGYRMFVVLWKPAYSEIEDILVNGANVVVADEAHYFKNPKTRANRMCSQFRTMSRIALTGSPLANNIDEYHAMINWVAPNFLGPLAEFSQIYIKPIQQGLYKDSLPSEKRAALKKLAVLKKMAAPKMMRATYQMFPKAERLPPKLEFVLTVAPQPLQTRLYNTYVEQYTARSLGINLLFSIVSDLGLICNHPRCYREKVREVEKNGNAAGHAEKPNNHFPKTIIPSTLKELKVPDLDAPTLSCKVELLMLILDEARRVEDKVLVFSHSIPTLNYLLNLCQMQKRRVCRLDGSTPTGKRQEMIKDFNKGDQEVYLISTKAGGVGLNIQGANRVVIFDIKWNPQDDRQAIGRAYRLGQTKPVYVYRLFVGGTFEDVIWNRHIFKTQLADKVVDDTKSVSWSLRNGEIVRPIQAGKLEDMKPFIGQDIILDKLISHKPHGEAILSIMSTETFEQEDKDVVLTPAEQREVDNELMLSRLRNSDPEAYKIQKARIDADDYQRAIEDMNAMRMPVAHRAIPPETSNPLDPEMPAGPSAAEPSTSTPKVPSGFSLRSYSLQGSAPIPLVGANTYFGEPRQNDPIPTPTPVTTTQAPPENRSVPEKAPVKGGFRFIQPLTQDKLEFERKLADRVRVLQQTGPPGMGGDAGVMAASFTEAVRKVREKQSLGFLHDNQHWRFLEELLSHDRFVVAAAYGYFSAPFVASSSQEELRRRLETINGLSEEDFGRQAGRRVHSTDPHNLQNIRRLNKQYDGTLRGPLARDDIKVMREAADKRKHRTFRLPTWANKALHEEQGRALPPRDIIESVENGRPESRNEPQ
ncbi:hypothetical protein G7046_g297 [Stylonectria norvegica]|nr:hypothetical protein G7046_g297 [Stylonectria norvegica]